MTTTLRKRNPNSPNVMKVDFDQEPFEALDPDNTCSAYEAILREFYKEVAPGHILYGQKVRLLARRLDMDDIVLELESGQIAYVHLTWCSGADTPPWPSTGLYDDKASFRRQVMHHEIKDFNARMAK